MAGLMEKYNTEQRNLASETLFGRGENPRYQFFDIEKKSANPGEDIASTMEQATRDEEARVTGRGLQTPPAAQPPAPTTGAPASSAPFANVGQYSPTSDRKLADELTKKANAVGGMEKYAEKGWKAEPGNEYAFRTTDEGGVTKIEGRGLTNKYGGESPSAGFDKKIEDLLDRVASQKSLHADIEITKALIGARAEREKAMYGLQGDKIKSEAAFGTAKEKAEDRALAREQMIDQKEKDRIQRSDKATEDAIKLFSADANGKQGAAGKGLLEMGLRGIVPSDRYRAAMEAELTKFNSAMAKLKQQREYAGKTFDPDLFKRDYMASVFATE